MIKMQKVDKLLYSFISKVHVENENLKHRFKPYISKDKEHKVEKLCCYSILYSRKIGPTIES